jgi:hypothetical protein
MQKMHIANSDKPVIFYSLDIVLAVGYRTNSKNAIKFRKWSSEILKEYILKGYAINKKRLEETENKFRELQATINFLQKKSKNKSLKGQESEILSILNDYSKIYKKMFRQSDNVKHVKKLTKSPKNDTVFMLF